MKKNKIEGVKDTNIVLPVVFLVLGIFFFLLEILNNGNSFKKPIHWISDPIIIKSENAGESVSEYFNVLANITSIQKELNDLRVKASNYESQLAYTIILEEENKSLRDEINLGNIEHTYIEADVLGKVQDNVLRVNAGRNQGVKVGNTVSIGSSMIGIIMETSENISAVRLPFSKSSTIEVLVVSDINKKKALSRAVVKGSGEEYMVIENISKDAGIKEGDYVLVNDEKVVDTLVLGKISELNIDPANTSIDGKIVPIVDYWSLISVFICTEW